jgi:hypothetical protein
MSVTVVNVEKSKLKQKSKPSKCVISKKEAM